MEGFTFLINNSLTKLIKNKKKFITSKQNQQDLTNNVLTEREGAKYVLNDLRQIMQDQWMDLIRDV